MYSAVCLSNEDVQCHDSDVVDDSILHTTLYERRWCYALPRCAATTTIIYKLTEYKYGQKSLRIYEEQIQGWTEYKIEDKDTSLGKGTRGTRSTRLKCGFQKEKNIEESPRTPYETSAMYLSGK